MSAFAIKEDVGHEDEAVRIAAARRMFAVCRESLVDRHRHRGAVLRAPSPATDRGLHGCVANSRIKRGLDKMYFAETLYLQAPGGMVRGETC